jgi:hypothetical protein
VDAAAKVLVIDADGAPPPELEAALKTRGFAPVPVDAAAPPTESFAAPFTNTLAVVRATADTDQQRAAAVNDLLQRLITEHVATIVWGTADQLRSISGPLVEWLPAEVGLDESRRQARHPRARYAPVIKRLRTRAAPHAAARRAAQPLLRRDRPGDAPGRAPAARLPAARTCPRSEPWSFTATYRPASWVSGDMYDVFRIDEDHLGMFVADAMGHGVAAGLLTMFLRQALVVEKGRGDCYSIVTPGAAPRQPARLPRPPATAELPVRDGGVRHHRHAHA